MEKTKFEKGYLIIAIILAAYFGLCLLLMSRNNILTSGILLGIYSSITLVYFLAKKASIHLKLHSLIALIIFLGGSILVQTSVASTLRWVIMASPFVFLCYGLFILWRE